MFGFLRREKSEVVAYNVRTGGRPAGSRDRTPRKRRSLAEIELDRYVRNQAPSVSERQQAAVVVRNLEYRQTDLASRMDGLGAANHVRRLPAHRPDE